MALAAKAMVRICYEESIPLPVESIQTNTETAKKNIAQNVVFLIKTIKHPQ